MSESEESGNEETILNDYTGKTSNEFEFLLIEKNDTKTLRRWLLKRKKEPKSLSIDDRGWTALHLAASRADRTKCVALLLKYRENVSLDLNLRTHCGKTALHIACEANCEENALLLLENVCDANTRCDAENSPLDIATAGGYYRIVSHLLRYGAEMNDQNPRTGQTALHLAAENNRVEICRLLLSLGANPAIHDFSQTLATHLACKKGHGDILRLICDFEPSIITAKGCNSKTVLEIAIECEYVDTSIITCLFDKGAKVTRDMMRSDKMSNRIFQLLLERFDAEDYCLNGEYSSVTCDVIDSGSVNHLSLLLESGVPKGVLQIPIVYDSHYFIEKRSTLKLVSPLGYLFNTRARRPEVPDETIDNMLHLLLKHDIVFMDEFWKMAKCDHFIDFFCIFPRIRSRIYTDASFLCSSFVKRHFERILTDIGVMVDYSLRCYYDLENMLFTSKNINWRLFYLEVQEAITCHYDIEIVQFFISNSCVLEPAVILMDLIDDILSCEKKRIFHIYKYLIELTPIFHQRRLLNEHNYRRLELFSSLHEEFAKSTLKQFCRSSIRQTLRGKTVKDDLLNFRRRIDQLPLPATLKKYILFQDS